LGVLLLAASVAVPAAPPLNDILRLSGKAVELFWEEFASINCTESVQQTKLDKDGKPILRKDTTFDYLVIMKQEPDELSVEESRVEVKAKMKKAKSPLLVTDGFSMLLFVLHPYYQGSFEFSQPQDDVVEGRKAVRIGFEHARGARSPSALRLRNRDYALEWRGTIWIDAGTSTILRIAAALKSPMQDLGLLAFSANVRYAPTKFSGATGEYWLPAEAAIEARSARQHWKNVHRFTNYKRFTVETSSETEAPKSEAEAPKPETEAPK
jgi:hypothetical protein